MKNIIKTTIFLLLLGWISILGVTNKVEACSDVLLNANSYIISGRNLDLNVDVQSDVVAVPAGQLAQFKDENGDVIASWQSIYGFVGVNAFHSDRYIDGLNEKGLSVATLTLKETVYPVKEDYPEYNYIPISHVVEWALGNFSTTEEVKNALTNTIVIKDNMVPNLHLHMVVHDESGKSMVVEFIDGTMKIYDSTDEKVLTNGPEYSWQLENLKNYTDYTNKIPYDNLQNTPEKRSGMPDLPGNSTATSRFVRAYFLNEFVTEPQNTQEAVEETNEIMGRLTPVRGEVAIKTKAHNWSYDYTRWTVIRDHQNRVIYFKDADNGCLRSIDLKKLNLTNNAPILKMPLTEGESHQSVEHFLQVDSNAE